MRIVAGELGGRRLISPDPDRAGDGMRPTAERVREALFSILGDVGGADVLDLFCGTGALGIEAISRGAASATLVDRDVTAAAENVEALGIADEVEVIRSDAVRYLARSAGTFDLVFCDPPYRLARRLGADLDQHLPDRLRAGSRVIVESFGGDGGTAIGAGLPLLDQRTYGTTLIRIHGSPER